MTQPLDPLEPRRFLSAESTVIDRIGVPVISEHAQDVALAENGAMFVTGTFSGTTDFDPNDFREFLLTAEADVDGYVAKYTSSGKLAWVKRLGPSDVENTPKAIAFNRSANLVAVLVESDDHPLQLKTFDRDGEAVDTIVYERASGGDVAIGNGGNIFLTGSFRDSLDLDGVTLNGPSSAKRTGFVAEIDEDGAVWAKAIVSDDIADGKAITVSSYGVYVAGDFSGTADLNPDGGTSTTTSRGSRGLADVFIQRYSKSGRFVWATRMGGRQEDFAKDIAVDVNGQCYITGGFAGLVQIPGKTDMVSYEGSRDAYIARIHKGDGSIAYALSAGGPSSDVGIGVGVDADRNVYVAGNFRDVADLYYGTLDEAFVDTVNELVDSFFVRIDPFGETELIRGINQGSDFIDAISNQIYGFAVNSLGFNASAGDFSPDDQADGTTDIFLVKYNESGDFD